MTQSTLTPADISRRLKLRKSSRTLAQLAAEIKRVTGIAVSVYHLSNVIHGRKSPGKAVLKYLGVERERPAPVYKTKR